MSKILVVGYEYWSKVAAGILRRAGFDAIPWRLGREHVPPLLRRFAPLRRLAHLTSRPFRKARAIHFTNPFESRRVYQAARYTGKRVIMHWIGTDVAILQDATGDARRKLRKWFRNFPDFHFADSPELIEKLSDFGIKAELFRLLPDAVVPDEIPPLPERPAVLAYWSPARRAFYGGEIVDALAREFGDVQFVVVGSDGEGEPQHPNMQYLGRLEDLSDVYAKVSVLVRMPLHDSLSAMVLEMLARRRRVIYNRPFPHTEPAGDLAEASRALRRCLAQRQPNVAGRRYVLENFSPAAESERLWPIYRRALGRRA